MKISVIIVAFKSSNILIRCLDSIQKYNDLGEELEVLVIDNSPEDSRVDTAIEKSTYKGCKYYPADNNGFGAGNNIGAAHAKGEILAFINPDIILIEPIFKEIYERFQQRKNLSLMGIKLLHEDLKQGFSYYYDYKYSIIKKWSLKLWNKLNYFDADNMYIAGADLFVRKSSFERAGKFDENIFMYYEEPDLIRRIRKAVPGAKIEFEPRLQMIHLEKKSTPSSIFSVEQEMESAIYYGRKYGLDYKKKVRFECRYYKIKLYIYKIISQQKAMEIKPIVELLENKYYE